MTSKYQPLIDRCNELYNQRVEVRYSQPTKRTLQGRVVGWCCDEDEETEPSLIVKLDPCDWYGGKAQEDYVSLKRVRVLALAAC